MADRTYGIVGMPMNNSSSKGMTRDRKDQLDKNTLATGRYTVKSKTKLPFL
ncbi:unnamed protein product [Oikopleura dioica]|uniref:Uncharacterized protein n=1 Tax=Oikopleura dioica TaxID=34765 RepID=E4YKF3_OIKDI|nr:unnamed protein product [Oikopleura dioica]